MMSSYFWDTIFELDMDGCTIKNQYKTTEYLLSPEVDIVSSMNIVGILGQDDNSDSDSD